MEIKIKERQMKNLMIMMVVVMLLTSCGLFEKFYDDANYESLTNEQGLIKVYSGGAVVDSFPDATILYSDASSQAMWITSDRLITATVARVARRFTATLRFGWNNR